MRLRVPRLSVIASAAALLLALAGLFRFTDISELRAVTLNGQPIVNWQARFGLSDNSHLLDQPVDSIARELLSKSGILRVDISYGLPGELRIRTNDFKIVSFVLDNNTGLLRGITNDCRVVEINGKQVDWENPVYTGIANAPLLGYCSDSRVPKVMKELARLRDSQIELYRLIDEVNFSHADHLRMSLAGAGYQLRLRADQLFDRLSEFIRFIEQFDPDTKDVRAFDLRFDDMIVRVGAGS